MAVYLAAHPGGVFCADRRGLRGSRVAAATNVAAAGQIKRKSEKLHAVLDRTAGLSYRGRREVLPIMFDAALTAFQEMFTPPFRRVLFKTLGLTILLLAVAFVGLHKLLGLWLVMLPYAWLTTALSVLAGLGLVI